MPSVIAYGCDDATTQFHPMQIDIREPGEGEIYFDVAYAGICHSDIHSARGEWGPVAYPLVPGHEFVGTVAKIGPGVTTFKVGGGPRGRGLLGWLVRHLRDVRVRLRAVVHFDAGHPVDLPCRRRG